MPEHVVTTTQVVDDLLRGIARSSGQIDIASARIDKSWTGVTKWVRSFASIISPALGHMLDVSSETSKSANRAVEDIHWFHDAYNELLRRTSTMAEQAGLTLDHFRDNLVSVSGALKDVRLGFQKFPEVEVPQAVETFLDKVKELSSGISKQKSLLSHVLSDNPDTVIKQIHQFQALVDDLRSAGITENAPDFIAALASNVNELSSVTDQLDKFKIDSTGVTNSLMSLQTQLAAMTGQNELSHESVDTLVQSFLAFEEELQKTGAYATSAYSTMELFQDVVQRARADSLSTAAGVVELSQSIDTLRKSASPAVSASISRIFDAITSASMAQTEFAENVGATTEKNKGRLNQSALAFGEINKKIRQGFVGQLEEISLSAERTFSAIRKSIPVALFVWVNKAFGDFNREMMATSSAFENRAGLFKSTAVAAASVGASIGKATEITKELVRYSFLTGNELAKNIVLGIKMHDVLGLSSSTIAMMVNVSRRLKSPFEDVANTISSIREDTRLTNEELESFVKQLGNAYLIFGKIKDVSKTIGETLRLEDAVRQLGGASGDVVKMIERMATTSEGAQTAQVFGMSPEDLLNRKGAQVEMIESIGQLVDNMTKGAPAIARLSILEDLASWTGLSVVSLQQLTEAAKNFRDQAQSTKTIQQRWTEEVNNFSKTIHRLVNSSLSLVKLALMPIVVVVHTAAHWLNVLVDVIKENQTVVKVLSGVLSVVAITAVPVFIWSLKKLAGQLLTSALAANVYTASLVGKGGWTGFLSIFKGSFWRAVWTPISALLRIVPTVGWIATALFGIYGILRWWQAKDAVKNAKGIDPSKDALVATIAALRRSGRLGKDGEFLVKDDTYGTSMSFTRDDMLKEIGKRYPGYLRDPAMMKQYTERLNDFEDAARGVVEMENARVQQRFIAGGDPLSVGQLNELKLVRGVLQDTLKKQDEWLTTIKSVAEKYEIRLQEEREKIEKELMMQMNTPSMKRKQW